MVNVLTALDKQILVWSLILTELKTKSYSLNVLKNKIIAANFKKSPPNFKRANSIALNLQQVFQKPGR